VHTNIQVLATEVAQVPILNFEIKMEIVLRIFWPVEAITVH